MTRGKSFILTLFIEAVEERFAGKTKIIASGTTAALDEVLKSKYTAAAALIEQNTTAIKEAYNLALEKAKECKKSYFIIN
ncbi:hypothetical protein [Desulfitibacter alkalitolerans]|uniref:hypothetical protein n=1 Tax=Desulfitibacter alkalitolerans TaxID=264641 RepID=UPI00047F4681|nr:hypothetical protein [Desulfitibacter alkalitolerans]